MLNNLVNYFGLQVFDILILFSVAAFALIWFRWTGKKLSSAPVARPLPPGPRGWPLVGYLPYLGEDLHIDLAALVDVYGPIYKFWMGTKLCVVVSSKELVSQVAKEKDTLFANRDMGVASTIISQGGHDIAFQDYGPDWKKLRKILVREMLSNTVMDDLIGLRREEMRKSVEDIKEKIDTPINIGLLTFQGTIRCIISMTIGSSLEGKDSIDAALFYAAAEELVEMLGKPNISDVFPLLKWFDLQKIGRNVSRVNKVFQSVFDNAIARQMKALNSKNSPIVKESKYKDLLTYLVERHHENKDKETQITIPEIKAVLTDLFVAATDTIATSVEWTMTELLRHPKVMNKVNEELKQIVGLNNIVEESHLPKLTYLSAVFKEALRVHPPGPFLIPRSAKETTIVGGYTIPKGSAIFLNVWAVQRDPSLWENPLEFIPERFLMGNNVDYNLTGNNSDYIPFGIGRRICPGVSLGEKMSLYTLASFLHHFDWKLPNDTELEISDRFGLVLKKKVALIAIPTPKISDNLV
ncbi:hypothetical protein F8388_001905 [Cannabis sativa]|uniref:Cytochrome P450 n=1 Tax=Cannabis sativa TaxID=3483 RepID=A0A7J6EPR7_CANSA|nr:hypothetical protein F8388_001905 [Cannabis sativa]